MKKNTLLIEILMEELPAMVVYSTAKMFSIHLLVLLEEAGFSYDPSYELIATPRRFGLCLSDVSSVSKAKEITKRGPSLQHAYDDKGALTLAALGWMKKLNIGLSDITSVSTAKGDSIAFVSTVQGEPLQALLFNIIEKALTQLKFDRVMRWGTILVPFVRPIHHVCVLYGSELIEGELLGVSSSAQLSGHRMIGSDVVLDHANNYFSVLKEKGGVIASFAERKKMIREGFDTLCKKNGFVVEDNTTLLDEVCGLVEYPKVLLGQFNADFLALPEVLLRYTMNQDQKYFAVYKNDTLAPYFLFVSNMNIDDSSLIIAGNEQVLQARFTDALFFYQKDQQTDLEDRLPLLKSVAYYAGLGSLYDKTDRLVALSQQFESKRQETTYSYCVRLCKCDLVTETVKEYPGLQGEIGTALLTKSNVDSAASIKEHYYPRSSTDRLPEPKFAMLALFDKLDLLVGMAGLNQLPKGGGDPFALRRAAIGVVRLLEEINWDRPFDLDALIEPIFKLYEKQGISFNVQRDIIIASLLHFLSERRQALYLDCFGGVLSYYSALKNYPIHTAKNYYPHFQEYLESEKGVLFLQMYKRVRNLLAKQDGSFDSIDIDLLSVDEKALNVLFESYESYVSREFIHPITSIDEEHSRIKLNDIEVALAAYFLEVKIEDEDKAIRSNRLALLNRFKSAVDSFVDFSYFI